MGDWKVDIALYEALLNTCIIKKAILWWPPYHSVPWKWIRRTPCFRVSCDSDLTKFNYDFKTYKSLPADHVNVDLNFMRFLVAIVQVWKDSEFRMHGVQKVDCDDNYLNHLSPLWTNQVSRQGVLGLHLEEVGIIALKTARLDDEGKSKQLAGKIVKNYYETAVSFSTTNVISEKE